LGKSKNFYEEEINNQLNENSTWGGIRRSAKACEKESSGTGHGDSREIGKKRHGIQSLPKMEVRDDQKTRDTRKRTTWGSNVMTKKSGLKELVWERTSTGGKSGVGKGASGTQERKICWMGGES